MTNGYRVRQRRQDSSARDSNRDTQENDSLLPNGLVNNCHQGWRSRYRNGQQTLGITSRANQRSRQRLPPALLHPRLDPLAA